MTASNGGPTGQFASRLAFNQPFDVYSTTIQDSHRLAGQVGPRRAEDEAAIFAASDTSDPKFIVQKRLVKEHYRQQELRNQRVQLERLLARKKVNERSTAL